MRSLYARNPERTERRQGLSAGQAQRKHCVRPTVILAGLRALSACCTQLVAVSSDLPRIERSVMSQIIEYSFDLVIQ